MTAWIAETLRRGGPKGERRASIPHAPGHRVQSLHTQRRLVCRWLLTEWRPACCDHPLRPLDLADDACQRALRWAPPGFVPALASAAESGHADIAPAAEFPA